MRLLWFLFLALLLPAAETRWVGSKSCRGCHSAIYDSYMRTPMAVSSGVVGAGLIEERFDSAEFRHDRSGYRYRVDGDYWLSLQKGSDAGFRRKLELFVGSGSVARSYLLRVDGFLFQAPVAYYAQSHRWELAPGYGRYDQPFLTRPIVPGCLQCHASRVQHRLGTQNAYDSPVFLEGGVACERCHGPGGAHVAGAASMIVNPAKLEAERRDSVCSQCHLTGAARVMVAGAKADSFVAGERLDSHTAVFVKTGGSGMRVTSHVEDLAQSGCKQASKDRLWCGSCHDAHRVPKPEQRASWYRSKCLNCHSLSTCKADSDDCVACHMPRNPVIDAEHVVYTNHAIGKRRRESRANESLVAFGKARASDRELGLAYAVVGQRENNDTYRVRARTLLEGVVRADSEALMYLAELYRDSDRARAIALYTRAIEIDPSQLTASVSLGAIRMEEGNYAEAIRLWNDALRKNPALLLVRTNLAAALLKVGDRAQAEAVLRKAADFNPTFRPR